MEWNIIHPAYDARLDFITSEMGVVLDLTINPLGEVVDLPEISDSYGESEGLGEIDGDFPSNFPIPSGAKAIPVPDKLKSEGYQLTFSYPDLPEMVYIQLITGFMAVGWDVGEFVIDAESNLILMPFTHPGSGFQGYALLTDNPDVLGLSSVEGTIITLHSGTP